MTIPYHPLPSLDHPVEYDYGPLSIRDPAAPSGQTIQLSLTDCQTYPGTTRSIWIHIPPGVDPRVPANFCLFQDGWYNLAPDGPVRAGIALDNLHIHGLLPPTIGIFVNPGEVPAELAGPIRQRNLEYDPFSPTCGTFLRNEVLPIAERYARLDRAPEGNVVCGGSSGGNCAFTVAWFHPDLVETSISFVSSFAQIPGGNPVPAALAHRPAGRLRSFFQIAHRDLNWDQPKRNWVAENLRVVAALLEHGHDVRCVLGDGGHNPNHCGVLLPDALIWAAGTTPRP